MSKILVAGIGAVGSNLVRCLIPDLKGEHEITVLDKDKVEERNITAGTQFYTRDQIGISKVEALQFNVFKQFEREINIENYEIIPLEYGGQKGVSSYRDNLTFSPATIMYDLVIDCLDNNKSREITQKSWKFKKNWQELLHVGFSDNFTFSVEWAENYQTPSDLSSGFDICTLPGAAAFVSSVAALGSLVAEEFILYGKKIQVVGNKFTHSIIK